MAESDQLIEDKYRIIIYHGHIHIMPISGETDKNDNFKVDQNPNNTILA
ncbi:MAG: hypothetical protein ACFFCY_03410 [Promethearchaeota archaeon]